MMLLLGILAVALLWWVGKNYTRADPKVLAKGLKTVAGVAALGAAVLLGVKGRIDMALLLGGFGAWALGWNALNLPGPWRKFQQSAGRFSRIRSAMIEMEIDHATGAVEGTILVGAFAGRRLSSLDPQSLSRLYDECSAHDPQGVPLLEAYLDRRFAGWRENAQGDRDTRTRTHAHSGVMTKEEAYQILGLQPGASLDEIRKAHRTLMKKLHPDQGGTAYLAARVNEAREVLLGRHR
ncbi:DnaJ domain-containing protein [Microvirga lotononidis]|uniref:DnaJ-class molecular chaperone with C-terminal Zn finger domain n=1 Tax=Microvirga lotononidis TaxID=864069 RepID=I4YLA2_9HYPH|nr:DnaJ domain-containing protein [Microvirga lotononidis]EIM24744.1 DnaJ-class molecular chaperone with C-terminal Zn finger domain [Microvirga lotononidis]WQO26751.1 DnaJ domain-containing protein [Microvirga lotononidis]